MSHIENIIAGLLELFAKEGRNKQKCFNQNLKKFKYFKVHAWTPPATSEPELMCGFTNDNTVFPVTHGIDDQCRAAFHSFAEGYRSYLTGYDKTGELTESLVIETSKIAPIELEPVTWDEVRALPEIPHSENIRSLLHDGHNEVKNLHWEEQDHYDVYFYNNGTVPGVELRQVWRDVDSYQKYGSIEHLIYWNGEHIGVVCESGKWFETKTYSVFDGKKWLEFIEFLHQEAIKECGKYINSITESEYPFVVIDQAKDAEDYIRVPGVTKADYSEKNND